MKKWITRIGVVLAIGLLVAIVLNWSLIRQLAKFSPIIIPPIGGRPADEAEARLQDIEYLERLLKYDRSYNETERAEFEALIESRKPDAATMSEADLYLLATEALALADNSHNGVALSPLRRDSKAVGVRYFHFADGLHVVRALAEHEDLIGARVLAIDGEPIDSLQASVMNQYIGGPEVWRRLYATLILESAEIMHAAGLTQSPDGYTLTVEDQDGATRDVDLIAYTPPADGPAPDIHPWRTLRADAMPDEGDAWVWSLQGMAESDLPLYLRAIRQMHMWQTLPHDGGYIRLQQTLNAQEQSLAAFFDENLKPLPDGSLNYLVVDLRGNSAGNFVLFAEIAEWLPNKVADDGQLYVIVGNQTLSGGLIPVAQLKHHGGEKTLVVGAPMGDRAQFWAEWGLPFRLPNAGWAVVYTTGYHDWADGCDDHPYCFTQVLKHGVAAGDFTPEHIIEPTYADYAAGRDVVMDWIDQQETP